MSERLNTDYRACKGLRADVERRAVGWWDRQPLVLYVSEIKQLAQQSVGLVHHTEDELQFFLGDYLRMVWGIDRIPPLLLFIR